METCVLENPPSNLLKTCAAIHGIELLETDSFLEKQASSFCYRLHGFLQFRAMPLSLPLFAILIIVVRAGRRSIAGGQARYQGALRPDASL